MVGNSEASSNIDIKIENTKLQQVNQFATQETLLWNIYAA